MPPPEVRRPSATDLARRRAALRDTIPPFVLLLVTQGSLVALDPDAHAGLVNLLWSLSPLIPAVWLGWAQVRILRRADEYERLGQLQALAIGFAATMLMAMTGSVLDAADLVAPRQSLQLVFFVGVLAWTGALAVITSRTR